MLEAVSSAQEEAVRARVRGARNIVIKVGSNVLVGGGNGVINRRVFCNLVESLANLIQLPDRHAALVTSGAVALGRLRAGRSAANRAEESLSLKQALASLGQPLLMHLYGEEFRFHNVHVAQLLLTRADIADRERFLNARNTLRELWQMPLVLPILNENDTVANDEIKFGDNDQLAALMTTLIGADLLIILSDVESLYDSDPVKSAKARQIPVAWADDPELKAYCGPASKDGVGTGGMGSKVRAAQMAGSFGVPTVLAPGRRPDVLGDILAGKPVGTLFLPRNAPLSSRKAWLRFATMAHGSLRVDPGALEAVQFKGRSLLPRGITSVTGDFSAGEVVSLRDEHGQEFARGLAAYSSEDMRRIAGHRSEEILAMSVGYNGDVAVHRDDLALLNELPPIDG